MKYSAINLVRNAFSYHENWQKAWSSAELKKEYDVIIVGGVAMDWVQLTI